MRIYERYFAHQIYWTFIFVLFAFSGLFFFFDLINELNLVGHGNYKFSYGMLRVALQMPTRFYEIIPITTLISAIYVSAQMALTSEYMIFRVSGLARGQAMASLLKIGIPIVLITYIIGEMVGPYTDYLSERVRFKAFSSTISTNFKSGVWVKDTLTTHTDGEQVTRFVNVKELKLDATIIDLRIYEFDSQFRLLNVRVAKSGVYQPPGYWRLTDVTETQLVYMEQLNNGNSDLLNPVYRAKQITLPDYSLRSELTPQIFSVLLVSPNRMSMFNLFHYIRHLIENCQDTKRYEIALWKKILYPLTIFVMLVLSMPFAYLHMRRDLISVKVFGGIILGISFQLFHTLFSHIGTLNTWPAPITAITPSVIYFAVGLLGLKWMDKH